MDILGLSSAALDKGLESLVLTGFNYSTVERKIKRAIDDIRKDFSDEVIIADEKYGIYKIGHWEIDRPAEVMAIGDTSGDFDVLIESIKKLGLASFAANDEPIWTGENKNLVVLGDILADRKAEGFKSLLLLRTLKKMAHKAGGKTIVVAGNHESFAYDLLNGELRYDMEKLAQAPEGHQSYGLREFLQFGNVQKRILENMRSSEIGRIILEEMCAMQVVELIDDTLLVHTDPTEEGIELLSDNHEMQATVDAINNCYQTSLYQRYFHDVKASAKFDEIDEAFLWGTNRSSKKGYECIDGKMGKLKEKGINTIIHAHSTGAALGAKEPFTSVEGIDIINIDLGAGRMFLPKDQSILRIKRNGLIQSGDHLKMALAA